MIKGRTFAAAVALIVVVAGAKFACASPEVLEKLNRLRAARGLHAFRYDAQLDAECEMNCKYRARRRITGHVTSVPPLRCAEGVGWGGESFHSCYAFTRIGSRGATAAGAASYQDASGRWYHTLRIKGPNSGSATGRSRSRGGRRLFRRRR